MNDRELERIEHKIQTAAEHAAPHQLDAILSACDEQKGTVIEMTNYNTTTTAKKRRWLPAAAVAAALALVLMGGWFGLNLGRSAGTVPGTVPGTAGTTGTSEPGTIDAVTTTALAAITFDVNPSVELVVDTDQIVTEAVSLNEDGAAVLGGMELVGTNLETATNALIGSFLTNGYLDELQNAILVSVEGYGEDTSALEAELSSQVSGLLSNGGLDGAVLSQSISADDSLTALAQQYGISTGKAALIQEIVAQDNTLTMDALAQLSITELALIADNRNLTVSSVSQTGDANSSSYLDTAAALEAACQQVGISSGDAQSPEVELDGWDGNMIYEVDFCHNGTEYEFDLDAVTGEVLTSKQEPCDHHQHTYGYGNGNGNGNGTGTTGTGTTGTGTGTDIGADAAQAAALADAGLDASQVWDLQTELDDGCYEVEFEFYDSAARTVTEYQYKIHRTTGAIVEREIETDRHYDDHYDHHD